MYRLENLLGIENEGKPLQASWGRLAWTRAKDLREVGWSQPLRDTLATFPLENASNPRSERCSPPQGSLRDSRFRPGHPLAYRFLPIASPQIHLAARLRAQLQATLPPLSLSVLMSAKYCIFGPLNSYLLNL
jgi:hypothetical protein